MSLDSAATVCRLLSLKLGDTRDSSDTSWPVALCCCLETSLLETWLRSRDSDLYVRPPTTADWCWAPFLAAPLPELPHNDIVLFKRQAATCTCLLMTNNYKLSTWHNTMTSSARLQLLLPASASTTTAILTLKFKVFISKFGENLSSTFQNIC